MAHANTFFAKFRTTMSDRAARKQLSKLSNEHLADMGLTRPQVNDAHGAARMELRYGRDW